MIQITKEEVKDAFVNKKGKRNFLLYTYYKEIFFQGFTADMIAKKISADLDYPINRTMIYLIKDRIIKKQKNVVAPPQQVSAPSMDTFTPPQVIKEEKEPLKEKQEGDSENVQEAPKKKYTFTDNIIDPRRNEYIEQLRAKGVKFKGDK